MCNKEKGNEQQQSCTQTEGILKGQIHTVQQEAAIYSETSIYHSRTECIFFQMHRSTSVVPEQILFYIGSCICHFPVSIIFFRTPNENYESRFHCSSTKKCLLVNIREWKGFVIKSITVVVMSHDDYSYSG
jgi:hypothetical protein